MYFILEAINYYYIVIIIIIVIIVIVIVIVIISLPFSWQRSNRHSFQELFILLYPSSS